jgi:hypothetical protein
MTATYKVGAASGVGCVAYARYVILGALTHEQETAAKYYAGDVWARDVAEPSIELRADLSAAFAARLGIDRDRHLSLTEFSHLMNNRRADGAEIAGKKKHTAHQSVASVFGLDLKAIPTEAEIANVLAGMRIDGARPRAETGNGAPLSDKRVESAIRKFKVAIGVPTTRDATPEEISRVAAGAIDQHEYHKQIAATAPPVGFIDITFSADKSIDVAWVHAPTEYERDIILAAVNGATADAMAYVETVLGVRRTGAGGTGTPEQAEMAWVGLQHYTARPAVDVVRRNAHGEIYTDTSELPTETADPHLHRHMIAFSSVLSESGKIGSLDLSRIDGELKVFGAVFHAGIATRLRQHGMDVVLGPHGEARLVGQPDWIRKFHSRRTTQGEDAAKEWAASQGKIWDNLTGEEQAALVAAGAAGERMAKLKRKSDEAPGEIPIWRAEAQDAGYNHRTHLRPDAVVPELTDAERLKIARNASLKLLDHAFQLEAVLPVGKVREIAARGLVVAGLGTSAARDIDAIMQSYRDEGILVRGLPTKIIEGTERGADNRPRVVYTTRANVGQEREVVHLVKQLAADFTGALTAEQIDRAAERVLARNPKIDPTAPQWRSQMAMTHTLGEGPRFGLAVGVAGSGKTLSVVATLTEAWHEQGMHVIAMTVPWRSTQPLLEAGVDMAVAVADFVHRVRTGKLEINEKTRIVADEVSVVGVPQAWAILRQVADQAGARVVMIGDPRQTGSVETPALELMAEAIGDEQIPKLLTSIRQQSQRGREIANLFREGRAEEGIALMREDGDFRLVAGGAEATIRETVARWRYRTDANADDPDYALLVMTPTNQRVLDIGMAIRANRREHGEIGRDAMTIAARITPKAKEIVNLPLAVGDKIRPFQRLFDADAPGRSRHLASNGNILTISAVLPDGLRVTNEAGTEGRITWAQLKPHRAPKTDPVRLTYGYVATTHTAQGLTVKDTIWSTPDGTALVDGNAAYVGLSRHTNRVDFIASDAAERGQMQRKRMLGLPEEPPREAEVIRNIATNLSRFETRRLATKMRRAPGAAAHQAAQAAARANAAASATPEQPPPVSPQEVVRQRRSMRPEAERPKSGTSSVASQPQDDHIAHHREAERHPEPEQVDEQIERVRPVADAINRAAHMLVVDDLDGAEAVRAAILQDWINKNPPPRPERKHLDRIDKWLAGEAEPDLTALAIFVIARGRDAEAMVEERLIDELDHAVHKAMTAHDTPLTDAQRKAHGIRPDAPVAGYLKNVSLKSLRQRRLRFDDRWTAALHKARYASDVWHDRHGRADDWVVNRITTLAEHLAKTTTTQAERDAVRGMVDPAPTDATAQQQQALQEQQRLRHNQGPSL